MLAHPRAGAFFGQQLASWEGHDGPYDAFDSDVRRALAPALGDAASDPALFGWNFETYAPGDDALRARLRQRIVDTDARGGINTLHWPMGNFAIHCAPHACTDNDNQPGVDPVHLIATDALFTDPRDDVERHAGAVFDERVDELAAMLQSLRDANGALIPIIVRPFHEMNKDSPGATAHWWAGRDPGDYRAMWRRMIDRLRADGVTNMLIAFAPRGELLFTGTGTPAERYARFWPETEPSTASGRYVDIAAFDDYLTDDEPAQQLGDAIDVTSAFATASARVVPRVSAIAECGRKDGTGSPCSDQGTCYQDGRFWTERMLPVLDADGGARWSRIAYLMTWANGTFSTYPGAPAAQADDFVAWFRAPGTLFLSEREPF